MKRPQCPFCGQVVERPLEIPPFHPGQMPVGQCVCGAIYACDVSGKNLGQALIEALLLACNSDLDLAMELSEGADFDQYILPQYDPMSHLIINKGSHEGRRISGALLFIRLAGELKSELPGPRPRQKEIQVSTNTALGGKRAERGQVEEWVVRGDIGAIKAQASSSDTILRQIQRLLYTGDPLLRGKASEALGAACSVVARYKPSVVTRILQGLFYSISDTASSSWGAFDAISEIISQSFELYASYVAQLYPFLKDNHRKEPALCAIARISKAHPKPFRKLTLYFIPFLHDEDPGTRAQAIRIMGALSAFEVKKDLEFLLHDSTEVSYYEEGHMVKKKVGELAMEAIKAIGD